MEAYPTKVREQVLGAYEQGMKTSEIARRFGVGPACAGELSNGCESTASETRSSRSTGRTRFSIGPAAINWQRW